MNNPRTGNKYLYHEFPIMTEQNKKGTVNDQ